MTIIDTFQDIYVNPNEPLTDEILNKMIQNDQFLWNTLDAAPLGLIAKTEVASDIDVTVNSNSGGSRQELAGLETSFEIGVNRNIVVGFSYPYLESLDASRSGTLRLAFFIEPDYSAIDETTASDLTGATKILSFFSEDIEDTTTDEYLHTENGRTYKVMLNGYPAGNYNIRVFGTVRRLSGSGTHSGISIKATGLTDGATTVWVQDAGAFIPEGLTDTRVFVEEVNDSQLR